MPEAPGGRWLSRRTSRAINDLLLLFKPPVPEAVGFSRCSPTPHRFPSPTRCIPTRLGQHLSTQGNQLPFCSAVGAEQVKGIPRELPPRPLVPMGLG